MPEFQRELPGTTGTIDLTGMLRRLDALGFRGPVVVEPWNKQIREMTPADAVRKVKNVLDLSLSAAGIEPG